MAPFLVKNKRFPLVSVGFKPWTSTIFISLNAGTDYPTWSEDLKFFNETEVMNWNLSLTTLTMVTCVLAV